MISPKENETKIYFWQEKQKTNFIILHKLSSKLNVYTVRCQRASIAISILAIK